MRSDASACPCLRSDLGRFEVDHMHVVATVVPRTLCPGGEAGARVGLAPRTGQDSPDGAQAAPIFRTWPVRESHDQVVKSSNPLSEWYSSQTSQRPSKVPPAWTVPGSNPGSATRLILASMRATPENRFVKMGATKLRPSPISSERSRWRPCCDSVTTPPVEHLPPAPRSPGPCTKRERRASTIPGHGPTARARAEDDCSRRDRSPAPTTTARTVQITRRSRVPRRCRRSRCCRWSNTPGRVRSS